MFLCNLVCLRNSRCSEKVRRMCQFTQIATFGPVLLGITSTIGIIIEDLLSPISMFSSSCWILAVWYFILSHEETKMTAGRLQHRYTLDTHIEDTPVEDSSKTVHARGGWGRFSQSCSFWMEVIERNQLILISNFLTWAPPHLSTRAGRFLANDLLERAGVPPNPGTGLLYGRRPREQASYWCLSPERMQETKLAISSDMGFGLGEVFLYSLPGP